MIRFDEIETGLKRGELFLEYLPTVVLETGRCVGAEALTRWRRPGGVVPPDEFIPVVEGTTLSGPLTYWVLETAAREVGPLLRGRPDLFLSVNVPPELLGRGGVASTVRHAGIADLVGQLVLEITERGLPDRLGIDALQFAAEAGCRIALDDAGQGGAHLVFLTRACVVHQVKVDRTYIRSLGVEPATLEWIRNLAALASSSGVEVVAEGVETAEQAALLRAAGVGLAQGHHFSTALPADELTRFVERR
ncbi:MAG TPA: EAL domain-containing protein [Thermoanaerobaculia bacterium]|nr:EAL domain-containing protein [Thermoanaerobaculia bacterium]